MNAMTYPQSCYEDNTVRLVRRFLNQLPCCENLSVRVSWDNNPLCRVKTFRVHCYVCGNTVTATSWELRGRWASSQRRGMPRPVWDHLKGCFVWDGEKEVDRAGN